MKVAWCVGGDWASISIIISACRDAYGKELGGVSKSSHVVIMRKMTLLRNSLYDAQNEQRGDQGARGSHFYAWLNSIKMRM